MKRVLLGFIFLLLLVVALLAYIYRPPQTQMMGLEPAGAITLRVAACDAGLDRCRAELDGRSLWLRLSPQPRPLQPFRVEIEAEGWQPQQAVVYFSMRGMEMGLNRFRLKQQQGVWQGEAMLPVCTDRRSDWQAHVFVSHEGERYHAIFGFTTQ